MSLGFKRLNSALQRSSRPL